MEAIIFIIFMTATLGLSLWISFLLPIAVGGFSLYMGLLLCRYEIRRNDGSIAYMVISIVLDFVILLGFIHSALEFPAEYSGERRCKFFSVKRNDFYAYHGGTSLF